MSTRDANIAGALALALYDHLEQATTAHPLLSGTTPAALVHLSHCRYPTVDSLRRVLSLSHSATVRIVNRLEGEGLVVRTASEADRRAVAVRLTETGAALVETTLERREAALRQALEGAFDPAERRVFETLSEKLLGSLTASRNDLYRICRLCDFAACPDCPVAEAIGA